MAYRRDLLVLLLFAGSIPLWAQKDSGGIVGTVKDSSGALVSRAQVTVTDEDRGSILTTQSNEFGQFIVSPLKIGRYRVSVEKPGFKKSVAGPIVVNVDERPAVDITLSLGSIHEVVEVTTRAPLLQTETSDLGQTVDSHQAETLPLNGRNYAQLALLGAGIAPSEPGSRVETSYGFSSNGARSLQNNYLLDGIDNNSNLGDVLTGQAYVIQPSIDAIEEFKVQTNAYSAEFGRGNGAVLNAVLKSGTNRFHGDLYEFFRNDVLDARNAFDIFGRQPYHQNQFGATLGGPIIKDRTFFFVDYEGFRVIQALPQLSSIPTQDEIGGDFSSFLTTTVAPQVDTDGSVLPGTTAHDCNGKPTFFGEIFNTRLTKTSGSNPSGFCGTPIGVDASGNPTNIFPKTGLIDPLAARLSALFPIPNVDINGSNFLADPKRTYSRNNFDIRIDHRLTDKDSLFGTFSYENQPSFTPSPFQNELDGGAFSDGTEDDSFRIVALSETHVFSPTLINEFRLGYNRINSHRFQLNSDQNVSASLGFPGVPFSPNQGGLPEISINDGTATLGSSGFLPAIEKQNSYVITENLTWVHGRHAAKFGTEIRRQEFTLFEPAASRGNLSFGSDFTDNPASPSTGGEAFATFLLGVADGGQITSLHTVDYHRPVYGFYGQDDFRATQHLTLNLGLRYDLFTTVKARDNQQANFDFSTASLIVPKGQTAQLTPFLAQNIPILRNGTSGLIPTDLHNFAPRVGFAYQVSDKLVMRGGYGIFYGGDENGPYSNPSPGFNPPFFVSQSYAVPCFLPSANPALGPDNDCSISGFNVLSQGFPSTALTDPNTPILFAVSPKLRTPYTEQWHLGFQYQLPGDSVLELSYAGSHGDHLYNYYNGNQAVPDVAFCTTGGNTAGNCPTAPRRPAKVCDNAVPPNCNGVFDTAINQLRSDGFSNYNSLQLRWEKHFTHGLQFEMSYTYAHALDDASSANLGSLNNGDFRDQRFPALEYGNSDFDVRHRFVISYIYQFPFGNGKRFGGGATGVLNQVIGNWQLAGIVTAQTGNWFTVTDTLTDVSTSDGGGGVGFFSVRPNVVGNPNGKPCLPGTVFNTCAFVDNQIPFTFGNAGRNIVRGPGLQNWDLSIFKMFPIREQMRLEFRTEFFNIWNHTNPLFAPSGLIGAEPQPVEFGTSQFGFPQGARDPRLVQFALKFYF